MFDGRFSRKNPRKFARIHHYFPSTICGALGTVADRTSPNLDVLSILSTLKDSTRNTVYPAAFQSMALDYYEYLAPQNEDPLILSIARIGEGQTILMTFLWTEY